jgi:hypothetical protein
MLKDHFYPLSFLELADCPLSTDPEEATDEAIQ